ncbi:MAG: hypothetical protein IKK63_05570 [Clostridia bacterium]|nr:hypothetical protein [Clostridia bacterium]
MFEEIELKELDINVPDDEEDISLDNIPSLKFSLCEYKKNVYREYFGSAQKNKVQFPEFYYEKKYYMKNEQPDEGAFKSHNQMLFENYILKCVKQQFDNELKSIMAAYALPQIMLKTLFENRGVDRGIFTRKTQLSSTQYSNIMQDISLCLDLDTLVNICWSLKIEYSVAKQLIEAYGYNLEGRTPQTLAYNYVLKYMLYFDLQTVNDFLSEHKVPHFRRKKR